MYLQHFTTHTQIEKFVKAKTCIKYPENIASSMATRSCRFGTASNEAREGDHVHMRVKFMYHGSFFFCFITIEQYYYEPGTTGS